MKKIHHLEGLRGTAAFVVFVMHFQTVFVPQLYTRSFNVFQQKFSLKVSNFLTSLIDLTVLSNMFLHVFWALSAYVIFKKFFEFDVQKSHLLSNTVKRYIRLMIPCTVSIFFAYFIYSLGFIYITKIPITTPQQNLYTIPPSFLHAVQTSVWSTIFNYDYFNSYNGPLWTIQREFYGSIFCFAIFGVVGRFNNRSAFYGLIFFCVLCLKIYWLNSFLLGYFLCDADFASRKENNLVKKAFEKLNLYFIKYQFLTIILFIAFFIVARFVIHKRPEYMDVLNSFLSISLIYLSSRVVIVTWLMSLKGISLFGRYSFGFYLLHWPVICSLSSWLYLHYHLNSAWSISALFVLTLMLCVAIAKLFYVYVDTKSIIIANEFAGWIERVVKYEQPKLSFDTPETKPI